jgi:hypothetical protein
MCIAVAVYVGNVVNSAYQKRWCKVKAKVLEGSVYESLKEGKRKTCQFFFAVSSICLFTARTVWSSRETQHVVHSQKLCVDTAPSHVWANQGSNHGKNKKYFLSQNVQTTCEAHQPPFQ